MRGNSSERMDFMLKKRFKWYLAAILMIAIVFVSAKPWQWLVSNAEGAPGISQKAAPRAASGATLQYYGPVGSLSLGSSPGGPPVLDLSGQAAPASAPSRYLSVSGSGNVTASKTVGKLYDDKTPSLASPEAVPSELNGGSYRLSEIWILNSGKSASSQNRDDWDIYDTTRLARLGKFDGFSDINVIDKNDKPYGAIYCWCGWTLEQSIPGGTDEENERHQDHGLEHLLKGESAQYNDVKYSDDDLVYVVNGAVSIYADSSSVIRFVYEETEGSVSAPAVFYDYDITDGFIYGDGDLSQQYPTSGQSSCARVYAKTAGCGINSDGNYEGDGKPKFAFGGSNTGTGLDGSLLDGQPVNAGGAHFGLVKGLDSSGHLVWDERLDVPNLFRDGYAAGKAEIRGQTLGFERTGDTYTLQTAGSIGNLDILSHPVSDNTAWTNNFWPMDSAATFGTDGHDLKFGAADAGRLLADGTLFPVSDDRLDHNSYFGMNFEAEFTVPEGYAGNLDYCFFGDDDMYVFLCDRDYGNARLIVDAGGVHGAMGEYVNLRDYINGSGSYKLVFYFLERGASRSTCWMRFTLPGVVFAELPVTKTTLSIKKEWDDGNDKDGIRPASSIMQVLRDNAVWREVELTARNNWEQVLTDVPMSDSRGNAYTYTLAEKNVPDGYTSSISGLTATNTHVPVVRSSLTARAIWDDGDDADALRPDTVRINFLRDGSLVEAVTLSAADGWQHTFQNMPETNPLTGRRHVYSITQPAAPSGYTASISGLTVTNTHTVTEYTSFTAKIAWDDGDNADGIRPGQVSVNILRDGGQFKTVTLNAADGWECIIDGLLASDPETGRAYHYAIAQASVPDGYTAVVNGFTITNTHTPVGHRDITVRVSWDDADNKDGLRPVSLLVNLLQDGKIFKSITLNAQNSWQHTFEGLPESDARTGHVYVYSAAGPSVPDGYTSSVNGLTITNTHTPIGHTSLAVRLIWDDGDDADRIRPESVSLNLLRDGKVMETMTLRADNGWKHTFTDMPVSDPVTGNAYAYSIAEPDVPDGYTALVNGLTVTNTHEPFPRVSFTVRKVWDDADDADSIRPKDVTINLLKDGKLFNTAVLNEDNNWMKEYPGLEAGHTYTVEEPDVPEGYTSSITSYGNGFDVTNTHVPDKKTSITAKIIWDDGDDKDQMRPGHMDVEVTRDGALYKAITLSPDNGWAYTLDGLPIEDGDGSPYVYAIKEPEAPDGYETSVDGFTITNTHILEQPEVPDKPETISVTVQKVWDDDDDADSIRPDTISVGLYRDSALFKTVKMSASDGWAYTFTGLPKTDDDGSPYKYTAREQEVPDGYKASVNGFTITNSHKPAATMSVTVKKTWDDGDNKDGIRPETVKVHIMQDGSFYKEVMLSAGGGWASTVSGLPVTGSSGKVYKYSVEEPEVPEGYTSSVKGFTVTNTHIPEPAKPEFISATIQAVWDDGDDKDKIRPASMPVALYQDGVLYASATLQASDGWAYTFSKLPKQDKDGNAYTYTVGKWDVPEGYKTSVNGFTITNSHKPSADCLSITIQQVWDDDDNTGGTRPDSITLTVLQDGRDYKEVTLSSENGWACTLDNLPECGEDGNPYKYSIKEPDAPDGYTISVDGFTVTAKQKTDGKNPSGPDGDSEGPSPDDGDNNDGGNEGPGPDDADRPDTEKGPGHDDEEKPAGVTPTKPDRITPTEPGSVTPTEPDGVTSTKPDGVTPTEPGSVTPTGAASANPGAKQPGTDKGSDVIKTGQEFYLPMIALGLAALSGGGFVFTKTARRRKPINQTKK